MFTTDVNIRFCRLQKTLFAPLCAKHRDLDGELILKLMPDFFVTERMWNCILLKLDAITVVDIFHSDFHNIN